MTFSETALPGVVLVQPTVHRDARGFFLETYHERRYRESGISGPFVQDNQSRSEKGTLRGLHGQLRQPQAKLVRAVIGEIFDVAVDVRLGSPTFGKWSGAHLTGDNFHQLYVPEGFVHGFCVLSETALVEYKCSRLYAPDDEYVVRWDDPEIGIDWPITAPRLGARDANAPCLAELRDQGRLPRY